MDIATPIFTGIDLHLITRAIEPADSEAHAFELEVAYNEDYTCRKKLWIETLPYQGQRLATRITNPVTGNSWEDPLEIRRSPWYPVLVLVEFRHNNQYIFGAYALERGGQLEFIERFQAKFRDVLGHQAEHYEAMIAQLKREALEARLALELERTPALPVIQPMLERLAAAA